MINLIDNEGFKSLMKTYNVSDTQLNSILQRIRTEFTNASDRIYHEILCENVPEIEVRLCQNGDNKLLKLGTFCASLGDDNHHVFQIFEQNFIDTPDDYDKILRLTVFHEMIHAMDRKELVRNNETLQTLQKFTQDSPNDLLPASFHASYVPILKTLQLLDLYRNEGIAELCSNILTDNALNQYGIEFFTSLDVFRQITSSFFNGQTLNLRNKHLLQTIYEGAANVLLRLLRIRGDISTPLYDKVFSGMSTGNYRLSNQELQQLLTACRSLSLYDYIQGMITLDKDRTTLTPIMDLLYFCADLQEENNSDYRNAFIKLVESKNHMTEKLFNTTMANIVGCLMTEDEITRYYIKTDIPNEDMKQKADQLFYLFTHERDEDRKRVCQWALTYFFDDEEVIHDKLPVFGTVDDLVVADIALGLLK